MIKEILHSTKELRNMSDPGTYQLPYKLLPFLGDFTKPGDLLELSVRSDVLDVEDPLIITT